MTGIFHLFFSYFLTIFLPSRQNSAKKKSYFLLLFFRLLPSHLKSPMCRRKEKKSYTAQTKKGHRHIFSIYHALWALTFFKFHVIFLPYFWLSHSFLSFEKNQEKRKSQSKDDTSSILISYNLHEKKKGTKMFYFYLNIIYNI